MANVTVLTFNDKKFQNKTADKFYQESVIGGRTSKAFSWDGARAIDVATLLTQDPVDYYRPSVVDEGDEDATRHLHRYGVPKDVENITQHMEITQDKAFSAIIDKLDKIQTNYTDEAGKWLTLQIREKIVPLTDKYALAKWNAGRGGYTVQASLTDENIVTEIGKHVTMLGNKSVGISDCICYIGYTAYGLLTEAKQFLNLEKLGVKALADGAVGKVKGLDIKPVPDDYLPNGVNFMTVKKESVLMPFQIKETKVHTNVPGISGALIEGRYVYDAFVLDAKKDGVISCLTEAPSAE
ncbi:MAG: hypothetical protein KBT03_06895 [Bacteroidales bacterium]|nr:hypothetical protein [Candidatus Scybalousia scybalohippi]